MQSLWTRYDKSLDTYGTNDAHYRPVFCNPLALWDTSLAIRDNWELAFNDSAERWPGKCA